VRIWCCLRVLSVLAAVSGAAILCRPAEAQARWRIQYFYDKLDSSFQIFDLKCPSAERCIAAGVIEDKNGHQKGAVVSTRDGGAHWMLIDVKENPHSLFFLNDSLGWMVTDHGIWSSDDGGASWKKLEALREISRVYFLDPMHGFAVGSSVYETADGGKNWKNMVSVRRKDFIYASIVFQGQHGIVTGGPLMAGEPVILETEDGGKHWRNANAAIHAPVEVEIVQGKIAFVLRDGSLHLVRWMQGSTKLETIFAEHNRVVTDFVSVAGADAILAAIEPPGNSNQIPIPGKLKMLRSRDLKIWQEMDVDYRAVAQRAILAAFDASHVWIATDTGMILKFE